MKRNTVNIAQTVSWNYKKADFLIFSNDKVWRNFLDVVMTPNEQLILDLYRRFYQAAPMRYPHLNLINIYQNLGGQMS